MLIFPSMATAFATADFKTLPITLATCFGEKSRISVARSTRLPRMSCSTWSVLRGVTRTYRAIALASMSSWGPGLLRRARTRRFLHVRAVAAEDPRRRELAQFVSDHVLRDVDRNELVPVVNRERVSHELRRDRRPAGPRLQHTAFIDAVHLLQLLQQLLDHVRSLLDRTAHRFPFTP